MEQQLMVWDYHTSNFDGEYMWTKVPTKYFVGSHEEELFWRVMTPQSTTKEFFYTPEDYQAFSGIDISELQEEVVEWKKRYVLLEREMSVVQKETLDRKMALNAATYAALFATQ